MRINETDKLIQLLSIIESKEEDYYLDMLLPDLNKKIAEVVEMLKTELSPRLKGDKYYINGNRYNLTMNASKMTAGQFIDYQAAIASNPPDYALLCAIFLIPHGKS